MYFSVTSLVVLTITTFCPGKSFYVSYRDSCLCVLEVHQVFLRVYHLWFDTGIRDKYSSVMFLVLYFCDKKFIIYYVFCDVVWILFSVFFFLNQSFSSWFFILKYLHFFLLYIFLLFFEFYSLIIPQQYLLTCPVLLQWWYFGTFAPYLCHHYFTFYLYYPEVVQVPLYWNFMYRGFFLLLKFLVLIVCSFDQISPKFCHGSSQ